MLLGEPTTSNRSRRRCADLARSVEVPDPFSMALFQSALMRRLARPLILTPYTGIADGAMFAGTKNTDYVLYDDGRPVPDQIQAIAHQIGHVIMRHCGIPAPAASPLPFFRRLNPSAVAAVLGTPVLLTAAEEREADLFAALIVERVALPYSGRAPCETTGACLRLSAQS